MNVLSFFLKGIIVLTLALLPLFSPTQTLAYVFNDCDVTFESDIPQPNGDGSPHTINFTLTNNSSSVTVNWITLQIQSFGDLSNLTSSGWTTVTDFLPNTIKIHGGTGIAPSQSRVFTLTYTPDPASDHFNWFVGSTEDSTDVCGGATNYSSFLLPTPTPNPPTPTPTNSPDETVTENTENLYSTLSTTALSNLGFLVGVGAVLFITVALVYFIFKHFKALSNLSNSNLKKK